MEREGEGDSIGGKRERWSGYIMASYIIIVLQCSLLIKLWIIHVEARCYLHSGGNENKTLVTSWNSNTTCRLGRYHRGNY